MEALRVPPYPLTLKFDVPTSGDIYTLRLQDLVEHFVEESNITSANLQITYVIPLSKIEFDRKYEVKILNSDEEIVFEDNLDIVRPYTDPNKLGTTASEITEAKYNELIARSIIDSFVVDGFYNQKVIVQTVGEGLDYIPLWVNAYKVLRVYENDVLIFDVDEETNDRYFKLSLDNSAVQEYIPNSTESLNRLEKTLPNLPVSYGDLGYYGWDTVTFPTGYDYTLVLDAGYKTIPSDIQAATEMLVNDIKCGRLDQYKRYVEEYQTDQYKVKFNAKKLFNGTGNIIVDQILSKYTKNITRLGIL
jgi:hypothetical protein